MNKPLIFDFKTDISRINIPSKLNNPFGLYLPEIIGIAANEFQEFIAATSPNWEYDFRLEKGKMFGVLVVEKGADDYGYLGAISGKLPGNIACEEFVPSVFDGAKDDFFFDKGMIALAEMGEEIRKTEQQTEIVELTARRKRKSIALQQWLFEQYQFSNLLGVEKNLLQIFEDSLHGHPPSGAGECTAPKLLQHAFAHQLTPIALAEFWWGNSSQNKKRMHKVFYPACKQKCRPILEYMLDDTGLFERANAAPL